MRRAALLLLLAACGEVPAPEPPAPAVLLVTLDTTRADRLGCYGDASARTPRLDALAAAGLRCARAWSPAPLTLPAHASLLSGTWPATHGARLNGAAPVGSEVLLLSEVLAARGFATGGFVGSFVLDARFGLAQGFDAWGAPSAAGNGLAPEYVERPAETVADEALAFLAGVPTDRPLFLWVHFFDPHQPLQPPARHRAAARDDYAAEIAFCDEQLGRLLDALAPRRPLVVVAADHGEGLGEHGEATHGLLLHEATQRVPLLLAGPGIPRGVLQAPASLVDVPASVLDALGLPPDLLPAQQGRSLLELRRDEAVASERALLLETHQPWNGYRWHPLEGLVWRGHKLVEGARAEVFDLDADPGELRDLSAARPDLLAALRARREALHVARAESADPPALPAAQQQALQALGYAGSGSPAPAAPGLARAPDPRDRMPDLAVKAEALGLLTRGRALLGLDAVPGVARDEAQGRACLERAAGLLEGLLALQADNPGVLGDLGLVELARGRPAQAALLFERLALLEPRVATTRVNLAIALQALGEPRAAELELQVAASLDERLLPALGLLAELAARDGRGRQAAFWLQRAQQAVRPGPDAEALAARVAALGPPEAPPGFPPADLRPARLRGPP